LSAPLLAFATSPSSFFSAASLGVVGRAPHREEKMEFERSDENILHRPAAARSEAAREEGLQPQNRTHARNCNRFCSRPAYAACRGSLRFPRHRPLGDRVGWCESKNDRFIYSHSHKFILEEYENSDGFARRSVSSRIKANHPLILSDFTPIYEET
jgi:hypothetical protein